ncbi:MAG: hypothetical protein HY054_14015 [Proteobacteria bacterium]|nr:hypothetical protein [Pseudomonadota bacterium]
MKAVTAILIGGLIAGALDILYAFAVYGPLAPSLGLASSSTPIEILQSVYGGWIGRDAAHAGGAMTAVLGACTHFSIAIVMAAVYAVLFARPGASNPILWGFIYGLILFVVMNYIVVPLSAAADGYFTNGADAVERIHATVSRTLQFKRPLLLAGTVFTHTVLVGIPIAWASAKFGNQQD